TLENGSTVVVPVVWSPVVHPHHQGDETGDERRDGQRQERGGPLAGGAGGGSCVVNFCSRPASPVPVSPAPSSVSSMSSAIGHGATGPVLSSSNPAMICAHASSSDSGRRGMSSLIGSPGPDVATRCSRTAPRPA